jgi:hypothetical protein
VSDGQRTRTWRASASASAACASASASGLKVVGVQHGDQFSLADGRTFANVKCHDPPGGLAADHDLGAGVGDQAALGHY